MENSFMGSTISSDIISKSKFKHENHHDLKEILNDSTAFTETSAVVETLDVSYPMTTNDVVEIRDLAGIDSATKTKPSKLSLFHEDSSINLHCPGSVNSNLDIMESNSNETLVCGDNSEINIKESAASLDEKNIDSNPKDSSTSLTEMNIDSIQKESSTSLDERNIDSIPKDLTTNSDEMNIDSNQKESSTSLDERNIDSIPKDLLTSLDKKNIESIPKEASTNLDDMNIDSIQKDSADSLGDMNIDSIPNDSTTILAEMNIDSIPKDLTTNSDEMNIDSIDATTNFDEMNSDSIPKDSTINFDERHSDTVECINTTSDNSNSLAPYIAELSPEDGATNVHLRQNITFKLYHPRPDQSIQVRQIFNDNTYEDVAGMIAEVDGRTAFAPTLLLPANSKFEVTCSSGNMFHKIFFKTGTEYTIKFQIESEFGIAVVVSINLNENRSQWDDFVKIISDFKHVKQSEIEKVLVTTAEGKVICVDSASCVRELVESDLISVKLKGEPFTKVSTRSVDKMSTRSLDKMSTSSLEKMSTRSLEKMSTRSIGEVSTKSLNEMSTTPLKKVATRSLEEVSTAPLEEVATKSLEEASNSPLAEVHIIPELETAQRVRRRKKIADEIRIENESYVGMRVAKKHLAMGVFFGTIKEYLPPKDSNEKDAWLIQYDDGEGMDFDRKELEEGMNLYLDEMRKLSPETPEKTQLQSSKKKKSVAGRPRKARRMTLDAEVTTPAQVEDKPTELRKEKTSDEDKLKENEIITDQEAFVGKPFAKRFKNMGIYYGVVSKYLRPEEDETEDWWTINYDDGDREDLDRKGVEKGIALYIATKDKKNEAGDTPAKARAPPVRCTTPVARKTPDRSRSSTKKSKVSSAKKQTSAVKRSAVKRIPAKRKASVDNNKKVKIAKTILPEAETQTHVPEELEDSDALGPEEFVVEELRQNRIDENGVEYYLVKWQGYPSEDDTWEPKENLNCPELLEKFINGEKNEIS